MKNNTIKCEHVNYHGEKGTFYQGRVACCKECLKKGFIVLPKEEVIIDGKVFWRIKK